jgi:YggT family protein
MTEPILGILRFMVAIAAAAAAVVALTHWAVRAGHLQPFGGLARGVRSASDPLLRPFEQRLVRAGGNPQQAPFWLFIAVLLGGLLLIATTSWALHTLDRLWRAASLGLGPLVYALVDLAIDVLIVALVIRAVGSWFGIGREKGWMRGVLRLTDWLVEPIRRRLPATGPFDWSVVLAWLVLVLARAVLHGGKL